MWSKWFDRCIFKAINRYRNRFLAKANGEELLEAIAQFEVNIKSIVNRTSALTHLNPEYLKPMLIALLEHEKTVDSAVNRFAYHFYNGKHPKHYLWTTHNDFIIDNVNPADRVVDVGSGVSEYTQRLVAKGAHVLAIDKNHEKVKQLQRSNPHPNVHFLCMDVSVELPPGLFDVAICSHILEHLDDPVAFLRQIRKITNKVIIKVPRVDSGWKKLMRKDLGMFWFDDRDHRREYTAESVTSELRNAGWQPVKLEVGLDIRVIAECVH